MNEIIKKIEAEQARESSLQIQNSSLVLMRMETWSSVMRC